MTHLTPKSGLVRRQSLKAAGLSRQKKGKRHAPYARINWSKAAQLFQRPQNLKSDNLHLPGVGTLLHILGAAGSAGLTFLFEAGRTSIFEAMQGEFSYRAWQARQSIKQLENRKYVRVRENADGSLTVKITKSGQIRALTYELDTMKLISPKHWDRKWRVVIFDIPEKHRRLRDLFRMRLQQLGLYQLQESVYVSPYPCFDEIEFLREVYGVSFTAEYLLVEKVENDKFLKNHFGL